MAAVSVQLQQKTSTATIGLARSHQVLVDRPEAKAGTDEGMMGGEMFLVALGGCFMSNLLAAIRGRKAPVSDIHVDVVGTMGENPGRFVAVMLNIAAHYDDHEQMEKLVTIAERGCLVANSIRSAVALDFNIQPLGEKV